MPSQVSLVAAKTRLQEWMLQIQDCKHRSADVTVEDWCRQHSITPSSYYYRLRRVREAFFQNENTLQTPSFVEISSLFNEDTCSATVSTPMTISAMLSVHGTSIQITDQASEEFIIRLLGAVRHAE